MNSNSKVVTLSQQSALSTILIFHSDKIIAQGLETYLTSNTKYQVRTVNHYLKCLDSANFLQQLGEIFVILVEGKLVDSVKCEQLTKFEQAKLILCDHRSNYNSLLLALNCNSSYLSFEHNDPQNLSLAIKCALMGSVFICPQAKKQLSSCVFHPNLKQRQALAQLEAIDQKILALASQGHNHTQIGAIVNYSPLNVGYRLRGIVQKLNLQTKQEAIALAINSGLVQTIVEPTLQTA
jgi:DNA-binding NarL/FixJ family response regulator